jgi:hypothetical protein
VYQSFPDVFYVVEKSNHTKKDDEKLNALLTRKNAFEVPSEHLLPWVFLGISFSAKRKMELFIYNYVFQIINKIIHNTTKLCGQYKTKSSVSFMKLLIFYSLETK